MSRTTAAWGSWAFTAGIAIGIGLGAERGACDGSKPDGQQTVPAATASPGSVPKLPIPSRADRSRAGERIKDLFEADFKKATARDAKVALANTLLSHTRDPLDPPTLYAMLDAAHRLATEAGQVAAATAAAQQLASSFAIEEQVLMKQTLKALAAKPLPAEVDALADELQRLANQQFARGEHSDAIDTMQLSVAVLRRGTDRMRQKMALDKLGLMKAEYRLLEKARGLEQQFDASPNDAEVADELGRLLCFEIDDWSRGLLFLAKSPDEALAQLAQREAAQPRSRAQAIRLGDGWRAFAATAKGAAADGALARARHHYAVALDGASGLDRLAIEKKIRDALGKGGSSTRGVKQRDPHLVYEISADLAGTINNGVVKPGGNPLVVTSWRDRDGLGIAAVPLAGTPPPGFADAASAGAPGVIFTGKERLALGCGVPAEGTLVLKLSPAAIANQRVVTGGPGPALRADGSIWIQAGIKQGQSTSETIQSTVPNAYQPNVPITIVMTWPAPLLLATNTGAATKPVAATGLVMPQPPWTVGGVANNNTETFSGVVHRVMVFDRAIGEREAVALAKSAHDAP